MARAAVAAVALAGLIAASGATLYDQQVYDTHGTLLDFHQFAGNVSVVLNVATY